MNRVIVRRHRGIFHHSLEGLVGVIIPDTFHIGVGDYGIGVGAYHYIGIGRVGPFGEPAALLIDVYEGPYP